MVRGRRNEDDDDMPQLFEDVAESDEDSEEELQDDYKEAQGDVGAEGSNEVELSGQEAPEERNILGFVPQAKRAIKKLQEARPKQSDPQGTQQARGKGDEGQRDEVLVPQD